MRLFQKHSVSFSIEGLADGLVHITIAKDYGKFQDVVGGPYKTIEEGIHESIDELERRSRARTIVKVK